MSNPTTISGVLDAKGLKIAILATRFNDFIVDRLTGGAWTIWNATASMPRTSPSCASPVRSRCPGLPEAGRQRQV